MYKLSDFIDTFKENHPRGVVILQNSAKCPSCEDEVVSEHAHDFVTCSCGSISVDGGTSCLRRAWSPAASTTETYTDTSITRPQTDEEWARYLGWLGSPRGRRHQ